MALLTPSDDSFTPNSLPVTGLGRQFTRQRLSNDWEPRGFKRYQYMRGLLHEMSVLGGPDDKEMASPERYRPASKCQDTPDCSCGRR